MTYYIKKTFYNGKKYEGYRDWTNNDCRQNLSDALLMVPFGSRRNWNNEHTVNIDIKNILDKKVKIEELISKIPELKDKEIQIINSQYSSY